MQQQRHHQRLNDRMEMALEPRRPTVMLFEPPYYEVPNDSTNCEAEEGPAVEPSLVFREVFPSILEERNPNSMG